MMIKTDGLTIEAKDEHTPQMGTRTMVTITYEDKVRIPRDVMSLSLAKARTLRDLLGVVIDNVQERL